MLARTVIHNARQMMGAKLRSHMNLGLGASNKYQCWNGIFMADCQRNYSIKIGDKATLTKTYLPEDVKGFADITLDCNPIHLNAEYAKTTKFGKPIVHGLLSLGLVGTICGMHMPGPGSVLVSFEMIKFLAPLFVGEEVTAEVELISLEKRMGKFSFKCFACEKDGSERVVLEGITKILIPSDKLA